jgi:hypothetical protein
MNMNANTMNANTMNANTMNANTMNAINDLETECIDIVKRLFEQYPNANMKQKIHHYIKNLLPGICENACQQQREREERKNTLEEKSDEFIEEFLAKTRFFYYSPTDLFFTYSDEKMYEIVKEDNIQHLILTTITSKFPELMPWKYKIKIQLMKRIKENNVLKSIPESETIQDIIQLLVPSIFSTKDYAKYFLTVIGDILHKKKSHYYFVHSKTLMPFFKELSQECYKFFGVNLLHHFKFKYYEHSSDECRLIQMREISPCSTLLNFIDLYRIINLFCVASHYSTRYVCGDSYLENYCNNYSVIHHALYLKNSKNIEILQRFINTTTEKCVECHISWKNMLYLWKVFIEEEGIPNIFFNHSLKQLLLTQSCELGIKIVLDSSSGSSSLNSLIGNAIECDDFIIQNRTSKHIPFVCNFISYWENNIICYNESDAPSSCAHGYGEECAECITVSSEEYELEIDELRMLFNKSIKKSATTLLHNNVSDKMLLGLVRHFYPDVMIEDDKYLIQIGIKPDIWNKQKEIEEFNDYYRNLKKSQTLLPVSSILMNSHSLYSMYQSYCKYAFDKGYNVVSKRWFEKYFISKYDIFLIDNTIVSPKWFQI